MGSGLAIIIPAYNEEKSIYETTLKCIRNLSDAQILIINDCSGDNTKKESENLQKKYPNLELINNVKNLGYGGTLKIAFARCHTKYIAFLDADGTYHPKYLSLFLDHLKKNKLDCVWGNRFSRSKKSQMPFLRKIGNRALVFLFALFTGKYVPDFCSGMRLFTREAIEKIDYSTLPNGLDMITAMTKRVIERRLRYGLLPIEYSKRKGKSKLDFSTILKMLTNAFTER
jgi:glycosyltransferase involved in cell wall biosynthesis